MSALIAVAVMGPHRLNRNGPQEYTLRGHSNGHRFVVSVKQAEFRARGRIVFWKLLEGDAGAPPAERLYYPAWKSGGKVHLFEGYDSVQMEEVGHARAAVFLAKYSTELTRVHLLVDGKRWPIA
ncbi:MAG TPA: hypothetical protein VKT78_01505, partial [Fimbriimonadaceae bacterium]|nr:hypothetical protein [Fimbriimonadaceae bacterium]